MGKTTDENFIKQLRDSGLKATKARIGLLRVLAKASKPLSVESIYEQYQPDITPDMATIYRALKDLQSVGLIRQVNLQHSHAHYEYGLDQDHHHFICSSCGRVEDINMVDSDVKRLMSKAIKKSKFFKSADEYSFEVFGLCGACQK